jgi:hypothetical protein
VTFLLVLPCFSLSGRVESLFLSFCSLSPSLALLLYTPLKCFFSALDATDMFMDGFIWWRAFPCLTNCCMHATATVCCANKQTRTAQTSITYVAYTDHSAEPRIPFIQQFAFIELCLAPSRPACTGNSNSLWSRAFCFPLVGLPGLSWWVVCFLVLLASFLVSPFPCAPAIVTTLPLWSEICAGICKFNTTKYALVVALLLPLLFPADS